MDHLRRGIHRVAADSVNIFASVLIASHLVVGCGVAAAKPLQEKRLTARVISEIDVGYPLYGTVEWCYGDGAEPTFAFGGGDILRYDVSGKLVFKFDATWEMGGIPEIYCSRDGKVLSFINERNTRLAIHTAESGLSEYAASATAEAFGLGGDLMSEDGTTFFLSSVPTLAAGTDVLRGKRVVQVGDRKAYWTDDVIFVQTEDALRFRMLRTSDLSEMGGLRVKPGPWVSIRRILKDGPSYFALVFNGGETEDYSRIRINDRRLPPGGTAGKSRNAASSHRRDRFRVEAFSHRDGERRLLDSILITRKNHRERIDLSKIKDPVSKPGTIQISPDGRFFIARREFEVRYTSPSGNPATRWDNHIVVLEIERK